MTLSAAVLAVALLAGLSPGSTPQDPEGTSPGKWIFDLSDDDPAVRRRALERLAAAPAETRATLESQPIASMALDDQGYWIEPRVRPGSSRLDRVFPSAAVAFPAADPEADGRTIVTETSAQRAAQTRFVEHWMVAAHAAGAMSEEILQLGGHRSSEVRGLVLAVLERALESPTTRRRLCARHLAGVPDVPRWTVALALSRSEPGRDELVRRFRAAPTDAVLFGIAADPRAVTARELVACARDRMAGDETRQALAIWALARKAATVPDDWLPLLETEDDVLRRLAVAGIAVAGDRLDGRDGLLREWIARAPGRRDPAPGRQLDRLLAWHPDEVVAPADPRDGAPRRPVVAGAAADDPQPARKPAQLIEDLDSPDPARRRNALRRIADLHPEVALGCVRAATFRPGMNTSLGSWPDIAAPRAREPSMGEGQITADLAEDDPQVVLPALDAICRRASYHGIFTEGCLRLLRHEDATVRAAAARAVITGFGPDFDEPPRSVMERVADAAKDDDPMVRAAVAQALGRWAGGRDTTLPILRMLVLDPFVTVRHAALAAMGRCVDCSDATGEMIAMTRDRTNRVREVALLSLVAQKVKTPRALAAYEDVLEDADPRVVVAGLQGLAAFGADVADRLPVVAEKIRHRDPRVRHAAILACHSIAPDRLPSLVVYLHAMADRHRVVREAGEGAFTLLAF